MEEIINKLDNWTIVKLIGGAGFIILAIAAFCGKLIFEKFKISWSKKADASIQKLNFEIEKSNNTISDLQANYIFHIQNAHNKKIEAIQELWAALNEIKDGIPSIVSLCLSILPDEEINNATLNKANNKGETFASLVNKLNETEDLMFIVKAANKVRKYRPFINEDLFGLFKTYSAITGRATHLFIWQYKKNNLCTWKRDENISNLLKGILTDAEFKYIYSKKVGAFNSMTDLLEIKILSKIRTGISGTDIDVDAVKQIKQLENIWKVEQNNGYGST